jgi:hypothetical protein
MNRHPAFSALAVVLMSGLVTACTGDGPLAVPAMLGGAVPPPAAAATPADPLAAFAANAVRGDSRVITESRLGTVRVTVGRDYDSAAGVVCRELVIEPATGPATGRSEIRAVCREAGGWRLSSVGAGR